MPKTRLLLSCALAAMVALACARSPDPAPILSPHPQVTAQEADAPVQALPSVSLQALPRIDVALAVSATEPAPAATLDAVQTEPADQALALGAEAADTEEEDEAWNAGWHARYVADHCKACPDCCTRDEPWPPTPEALADPCPECDVAGAKTNTQGKGRVAPWRMRPPSRT